VIYVNHTPQNMTRAVLETHRSALIRAEVLAGKQRAELERAARDAIVKLGLSIDEVSEATGLTPAELRQIASEPAEIGLDALAGVA
jgi:predicted transposase YdaD